MRIITILFSTLLALSLSAQTVAPWLMAGKRRTDCPFPMNNLIGWYAADDLVLSDGNLVTNWTDRGPFGNTLIQASITKQPTYKTGIIGGKPVVRFDGVDNTLTNITPSGIRGADGTAPAGQNTWFMVMQSGTLNGLGMYLTLRQGEKEYRNTGATPRASVWFNGSGTCSQGNLDFEQPSATPIFILMRNEGLICSSGAGRGKGTGYINGIEMADHTDADTDLAINEISLGSRSGIAFFAEVDIAEFAVWERQLNPCELDTVFRYLSTKYSLP